MLPPCKWRMRKTSGAVALAGLVEFIIRSSLGKSRAPGWLCNLQLSGRTFIDSSLWSILIMIPWSKSKRPPTFHEGWAPTGIQNFGSNSYRLIQTYYMKYVFIKYKHLIKLVEVDVMLAIKTNKWKGIQTCCLKYLFIK